MILVTGATGHIGNVLIQKLLERGEKVRALVWKGDETISLQGLPVEQVEGDVLEPSSLEPAMKGVKTIFHLAGVISILPGKHSHVWDVNVKGTHNMLEAAKRWNIRRFIYTSSIHALRRAPMGSEMDENLGYDVDNPYGEYDRSKAAASLEVQKASEADIDAVIACPTGVIGPYDFRGSEMGEVIRGAAGMKPVLYVEGAYDFVDVRDVAEGLIAAAEKGRRGESYILGGHRVTVRDLIDTIQEVTGKALTRIKIPFPLAEFAAKFTPWYYQKTKSPPRFTPYSLDVLRSNSQISHAKAARELGFHPRSVLDTIADTVHWLIETRRIPQPISLKSG